MFIVTSIFTAILTLFYLVLTLRIITIRETHKVSLGDGGVDELQRAIRAHGNFAEYVPIALICLACLEGNGAPWWITVPLGIAIVTGRVLHALGMSEAKSDFRYRVKGMKFTINTLMVMVLLNICLAVSRILSANIN